MNKYQIKNIIIIGPIFRNIFLMNYTYITISILYEKNNEKIFYYIKIDETNPNIGNIEYMEKFSDIMKNFQKIGIIIDYTFDYDNVDSSLSSHKYIHEFYHIYA